MDHLGTQITSTFVCADDPVVALGLVDAETPPTFNSITAIARRMFDVPVALISIVQEDLDRQFFLSQQGLTEPWLSARQTPLSHSFCQHVKRAGEPLAVSDAREHPVLKGNLAIRDLNVIAYLGVPITLPNGDPIGALCVIDTAPRVWTAEDTEALNDLANCVNDEILLRATLLENQREQRNIQRYNEMRESIAAAFMVPELSIQDRFKAMLTAGCQAFGMTSARIVRTEFGRNKTMFEHGKCSDLKEIDSEIRELLARTIATECRSLHVKNLGEPNILDQFRTTPKRQGSYLGAPLIFGGALFGMIEFFNDTPKSRKWSEEEISILSIVSMFTTANLGVFGEIEALQRSETALLQHFATHEV